MNELLDFKKRAISHGVCDKYGAEWDAAENRKDLIDVALSAQGIEYVAKSIADGWGVSATYLARDFKGYVNGGYRRDKDGYSSEMYASFDGTLTARSTMLLLVGCKCEVHVPHGMATQLYLCGGSKIKIRNEGYCAVYVYADGNAYEVEGREAHVRLV